VRQLARSELAASTGPVAELREADALDGVVAVMMLVVQRGHPLSS
jgi:hypothetical protein